MIIALPPAGLIDSYAGESTDSEKRHGLPPWLGCRADLFCRAPTNSRPVLGCDWPAGQDHGSWLPCRALATAFDVASQCPRVPRSHMAHCCYSTEKGITTGWTRGADRVGCQWLASRPPPGHPVLSGTITKHGIGKQPLQPFAPRLTRPRFQRLIRDAPQLWPVIGVDRSTCRRD